jgi:hypothetical protein
LFASRPLLRGHKYLTTNPPFSNVSDNEPPYFQTLATPLGVNKNVLRRLSFCTDLSILHDFLPAIAAAHNALPSISSALSWFFTLFGKNFELPFDTALSDNIQSFREIWDTPELEFVARRLEIMRHIVKPNDTEASANTQALKNANLKPHDFQPGDRVFVDQQLGASNLGAFRHTVEFIGPFVILEVRNNLVKLAHILYRQSSQKFHQCRKN